MANSSPWIVETSSATFMADVVERSRQVPVVVDFWATWCQPCRLLAPLLEKLAEEYAGRFVLVKANTESLPEMAQDFGVQSIPAVFGLRDGRILDQFLGVLPERELRAWLDRLLPTPAEQLAAEATKLIETDPVQAEARFRQAVDLAPQDAPVKLGLARALFAQQRLAESLELVRQLEERGYLEPEAEKLKSQLELRQIGSKAVDLDQQRVRAGAAPDNLEVRFELAQALAAAGQYEEALEAGLMLVQRDRKRFGEKARQLMVDIFRVLPEGSELVNTYRRKLSTSLY